MTTITSTKLRQARASNEARAVQEGGRRGIPRAFPDGQTQYPGPAP